MFGILLYVCYTFIDFNMIWKVLNALISLRSGPLYGRGDGSTQGPKRVGVALDEVLPQQGLLKYHDLV